MSEDSHLDRERTVVPDDIPRSLDSAPTYGRGETPADLRGSELPEDIIEEQRGIVLDPGHVIGGRFEVIDRLGFGGMGAVYKVSDNLMAGEVKALKVMLPSLIHSEALRQRFIAEVQVAQRLSHRNIVKVHDVGTHDNMLFFTMEFVEGKTLHRHTSDNGGTLSVEESRRVADLICAGLEEAHRSTIHRDLKPQNIMIEPEGSIKILDFGLAKLMSPGRMTRSSMALGTAYYQAPEQIMAAGSVDSRADIYSLGVMLYEMLTGKLPRGRAKAASKWNPDVSEQLDELIDRMLETEPDERPESVVAVRRLLKETRKPSQAAPPVKPQTDSVTRPVVDISTVEPEMVHIPGGTFTMGSKSGGVLGFGAEGKRDERPQHDVTISDFYMGKYEVTFEQYDAFCDATGESKPDDEGWGRGNRPAINVSWNDATAYCEWLSEQTGKKYRLPTEAESEYACRAGTTTRYSCGDSENSLDSYAWYSGNSGRETHEVGEKKPNPWGLYDMHGNVWEWCADWYDADYYSKSPRNDPQGPSSGEKRVLRGGSWLNNPVYLRSADRYGYTPDNTLYFDGFRVCHSGPAG